VGDVLIKMETGAEREVEREVEVPG